MKTIASLFICALLATAASAAVTRTIEETYPFAPDGVITLSNVNGSIEIAAWDRNEVHLVAELRAKTQEDLDRITVNIDPQPARLSIETKHEKRRSWFGNTGDNGQVRYTLQVPAGIRLESLRTVNSSVRLNDLTGGVNAHTVNGSVKAAGLAGEVELETVNGSIEADFRSVDAESSIKLETVNGSCELALPQDTNARLKAGTVNGRVRSDLPVTLEKSSRRSLRGTLGSGGTLIDLGSVNGSITIRGR